MINETLKKELHKEAERIEEDMTVTAKAQYNDAARWRSYHFWLAVSAAFFAAVAGFSAIAEYAWGTFVVIGASFLSASLSTILSVLKPLERSQLHHKAGGQFQHLRDDTRIFKNISLQQNDVNESEITGTIKSLSDKRATIREGSPQHSDKAYKKALAGIEAGQATYETDKK